MKSGACGAYRDNGVKKKRYSTKEHRKRNGEGINLANLRLWLIKPNLVILPFSTLHFWLSRFLSHSLLLLLVRQISLFLVTSNDKIYRQFGAGYEATRRLDDVESKFWQLMHCVICMGQAFIFIYLFFSQHTWSFRIVDDKRTC